MDPAPGAAAEGWTVGQPVVDVTAKNLAAAAADSCQRAVVVVELAAGQLVVEVVAGHPVAAAADAQCRAAATAVSAAGHAHNVAASRCAAQRGAGR